MTKRSRRLDAEIALSRYPQDWFVHTLGNGAIIPRIFDITNSEDRENLQRLIEEEEGHKFVYQYDANDAPLVIACAPHRESRELSVFVKNVVKRRAKLCHMVGEIVTEEKIESSILDENFIYQKGHTLIYTKEKSNVFNFFRPPLNKEDKANITINGSKSVANVNAQYIDVGQEIYACYKDSGVLTKKGVKPYSLIEILRHTNKLIVSKLKPLKLKVLYARLDDSDEKSELLAELLDIVRNNTKQYNKFIQKKLKDETQSDDKAEREQETDEITKLAAKENKYEEKEFTSVQIVDLIKIANLYNINVDQVLKRPDGAESICELIIAKLRGEDTTRLETEEKYEKGIVDLSKSVWRDHVQVSVPILLLETIGGLLGVDPKQVFQYEFLEIICDEIQKGSKQSKEMTSSSSSASTTMTETIAVVDQSQSANSPFLSRGGYSQTDLFSSKRRKTNNDENAENDSDMEQYLSSPLELK
jgi:hypothetical protein